MRVSCGWHERHAVLALDSDFSVYRKHGGVPLALIHPAGGRRSRSLAEVCAHLKSTGKTMKRCGSVARPIRH
jgi:hypothetical protein